MLTLFHTKTVSYSMSSFSSAAGGMGSAGHKKVPFYCQKSRTIWIKL